ncbi:putative RNA-directed DNA polymerase from transposon X-element [Araneus ventricosus]|uniref:Putative RNA-directed DNA polymerase from transposon X-element n=1 Tax=Araneus ventricosus TaxID=182803 RepID=A0A4Y2A205_ARAVE|nr:putative RNA-directed DNA polymerase from transposon X-element [Araneus ventricosus]
MCLAQHSQIWLLCQKTQHNQPTKQHPQPFILMGDFNGHNPIWGSADFNVKGQQVEALLEDHQLCLLNDESFTYFHIPSRTFHTLDLAICSPSLAIKGDFSVAYDLHNSDHFPIILSYSDDDVTYPERPKRYIFNKADWTLFSRMALISKQLEKESIDDVVYEITDILMTAADAEIPKTSGKIPKNWKPWWNEECGIADKKQAKAWNRFRRYPTTDNFIAFKQAKANTRRIRRRILNSNGQVITDIKKIANALGETFATVPSETSYPQEFITYKTTEEGKVLNFTTNSNEEYNSDFNLTELKRAIDKSHPTSPGTEDIHLNMIIHLTDSSLINILRLFNRIWREHRFPNSWRRALIIPIAKPGKDSQDPTNYRPIALTSCLHKILERMVNARLVYILETNNLLSPFQSGFLRGRSTLDNILRLETSIREAFVSKKHLVSIMFDMEKAYDRTWSSWYGVGEIKSTKKLRSGDLLVEVESPKQAKEISKMKSLSTIHVTVKPHATLNSSKGVISCGELLNKSEEKITEELKSQGVVHVRRITIRRDGQLLNTKHLILTFDSNKLPEHIKAGYMRLSVRTYMPNPLRCFKCQRFGHSKTSCRGTLTCARWVEVGHESTDCTRTEKCVNCKGEHTSFSRNCFAWKQEKEIISTKIKKQISFQEARKLEKSQTPTPGNSYVSVAKQRASAPSADRNKDISAVPSSKPSDSTKASPPITNLKIPTSPPVAPVSEEALASPDFTDFKLVTNQKRLKKNSPTKTNNTITKAENIAKFYTTSHREVTNPIPTQDNISTHQSALKRSVIAKPTSVDIELLPMAVLPPLEKRILQSRESDADAEMISSSASEEDALEYNMSEDLEDSPAVISPPPSSKPEKANKYKNR